tara:strand:+ start:275 stop:1303 length:1029 start_codon:yes stop_codon:yes gene_type:complete
MSPKSSNVKIKIPKLFKDKLVNKRIKEIYKNFENSLDTNQNFVVSVSGGADSLALAFLAKIYSFKKKLNPKFLIIDHKLRSESSKEAKLVKKVLERFFIHADIVSWKGKKPTKNIQSLARNKRYEFLFEYCDKFKIDNILIGHHIDDLFENFFIRMLRGSGLNGLISLDTKSKVGNKNLLRPLLNQSKEDLVYISKKVFNFYINDPTNDDEKYLRTRVRKLISDLQNNGLDKNKFLKTIKNLKDSNFVVDFYVKQNLFNNTFFSKKNNQLILNKNFFQQPNEVIFRAFSESINLIGKRYYSVRGKKLDRVIDNIKNDKFFKVTLGGCIIKKVSQTVIISKEQ